MYGLVVWCHEQHVGRADIYDVAVYTVIRWCLTVIRHLMFMVLDYRVSYCVYSHRTCLGQFEVSYSAYYFG